MSQAFAANCSTLTPKVGLAPQPTDAVVGFALNSETLPAPPPPPQPTPFSESISTGGAELWVAGQQVSGTQVTAEFDGTSLTLGGRTVTFQAPQTTPIADNVLLGTYGSVPRVSELIASGVGVSVAVEQYLSEFNLLLRDAIGASETASFEAGVEVLRTSPLVSTIRSSDSRNKVVVLERTGMLGGYEYELRSPQLPMPAEPTVEAKARALVRSLTQLVAVASPGLLVLVTEAGNLKSLTGERAEQARAQIAYLKHGGTVKTLPSGPLKPDSWYIREIAATERK